MKKPLIIKQDLFLGYLYFIFTVFITIIFIVFREYDLRQNYDAYNYLNGYNYLYENPFKLQQSYQYFGRFPERIFAYFISTIAVIGKLSKPYELVLYVSIFIFAMMFFVYRNIDKLFNFNSGYLSKGLLFQILIAIVPLGLTAQTLRQAFGFFVFLSALLLIRRVKYFRLAIPAIILIYTHVSSALLIILYQLSRTRNWFLLTIFGLIFLAGLSFFASQFSSSFRVFRDFSLFRFHDWQFFDKYAVISLSVILFVQGLSLFRNFRLLAFSLSCLVYIIASANGVIPRFLYGAGWFWIMVIGFHFLRWNRPKAMIFKLRFSGGTLIFLKSLVVLNLLS